MYWSPVRWTGVLLRLTFDGGHLRLSALFIGVILKDMCTGEHFGIYILHNSLPRRDIKPHNFVLRTDGHLLLIDFGTAAELLPPALDGSQRLPKKHCLVPCGTCDYISPEILRAHELALVALELDDEIRLSRELNEDEAYGRETDWWSVGAMLYEMTFGITPFFAEDIRTTYAKIIDSNVGLLTYNILSLLTHL